MTDREKAIVMAYTGVTMLTGDKLMIFYRYLEDIMGRPVYSHELGFIDKEIRQKSLDDFIKLCETTECEQTTLEDAISRKSIKQKLQEHHDFFVNAYGGFSNLPQNDKSRVDEIINCIAMVVNEPSVKPQEPRKGHWKKLDVGYGCSECSLATNEYGKSFYKYCPNCGAKMERSDKE